MKKTKTYQVSKNFQMAFSAIVLSIFTIHTVSLLWLWYNQYSMNPYVGGFESWVAVSIGLPMAVFVAAWIFRPAQATQSAKIFDTLLVSVAGLQLYSIVNLISSELYMQNIIPGSGAELSKLYELSGSGIFLVAYISALLYLRTVRKWR